MFTIRTKIFKYYFFLWSLKIKVLTIFFFVVVFLYRGRLWVQYIIIYLSFEYFLFQLNEDIRLHVEKPVKTFNYIINFIRVKKNKKIICLGFKNFGISNFYDYCMWFLYCINVYFIFGFIFYKKKRGPETNNDE